MKLHPVYEGSRDYDKTPVTVTDPCYNKDVWCRLDNVRIKPGRYNCIAWKGRCYYTDENKKRHSYQRVFCCGIYLDGNRFPNREDMEEIGSIGVDAGLAGFFQNKPDYTDDEWGSVCESVRYKNAAIRPEGFFTSTGWGDGWYPVFAGRDADGDIVALEISF